MKERLYYTIEICVCQLRGITMGIHRQENNVLLDAPLYELSASYMKLLDFDDMFCVNWGTLACLECEASIPEGCGLNCRMCELECPCHRRDDDG